MRVSSRDEIQVGRGCRVSGGRHPCRLRRRQRAEWDVQRGGRRAAGKHGTANTWMAPLAADAGAEEALEWGVGGRGRRERPDLRRVSTQDGRYRATGRLRQQVGRRRQTRKPRRRSLRNGCRRPRGFLASNDLSRAYGAKYGFVVKAENVDGLGDEAWRLWAHGHGREVTYQLTRQPRDRGACPLLQRLPTDGRGCRGSMLWADAIDEEAAQGWQRP